MKNNIDTNLDLLSKEQLAAEARKSKNRVRVNLLCEIHAQIEDEFSMDTAYGYNPANDQSFTGEFEAIGV